MQITWVYNLFDIAFKFWGFCGFPRFLRLILQTTTGIFQIYRESYLDQSFCQNDSLIGGSLWQKDKMVTHILFDLCIFKHFSPVANFGYQSLYQDCVNCIAHKYIRLKKKLLHARIVLCLHLVNS